MNSEAPIARKRNPRENANWLSLISYFFTYNTLIKGYRNCIRKGDIYEIVNSFKSERLGSRLQKEWKSRPEKHKLEFLVSLLRIFWKQYLLLGITLAIVESSNVILNPILIGKITSYFTPGQTEISFDEAWMYALGLTLTTLIYDCYMNLYFLFLNELFLKIKAACCALIYRKCLRLSENSLAKCANGFAVTLMTKDLLIFEYILDVGLVMVNGVFQAVILFYVMYNTVGVAGLLGVTMIFLVFPIQGNINYI